VRTRERCTARVQRPVDIGFKVNGVVFRFSGILQWSNGRDLLGIQFVNMIPGRMVELANLICEMEAVAQARADVARADVNDVLVAHEEGLALVSRDLNNLAARKIDEPEMLSGMRNGARLPAPQMEASAAQPAARAEVELENAASPKPRDRRKTLRHEVDTSATIFLVKVGSTLRGRILDLSLTGCRIRTDERFPVGIYTRVETEFRLQGLPFRLGGVTQAIHDRNTVGIRFLDLSDRKREQVSDLIEEIEQMRADSMPAEPSAAQATN